MQLTSFASRREAREEGGPKNLTRDLRVEWLIQHAKMISCTGPRHGQALPQSPPKISKSSQGYKINPQDRVDNGKPDQVKSVPVPTDATLKTVK